MIQNCPIMLRIFFTLSGTIIWLSIHKNHDTYIKLVMCSTLKKSNIFIVITTLFEFMAFFIFIRYTTNITTSDLDKLKQFDIFTIFILKFGDRGYFTSAC